MDCKAFQCLLTVKKYCNFNLINNTVIPKITVASLIFKPKVTWRWLEALLQIKSNESVPQQNKATSKIP